jgi:acetyltransferase-like isoleucine patch superfamily enzyme
VSLTQQLRYYLRAQSTSLPRYVLEQTVMGALGWVPGLVGVGLRALGYKLILESAGLPLVEHGVRLAQPANIRLGKGVYLDARVYLHACPDGISLGAGTTVMHGASLHVFNFRNLPHAGIHIGENCFIGEFTVIRGQGGVTIGDKVFTGPLVQILAVNHVTDDPEVPIVDQGITAQGIVIEDDVWLAAGAIVLDGAHVGRGSVVGAGAVVTGDLPPYSVAVGSPAKVIRDRRDQERARRQVAAQVHFGELDRMRAREVS